VNIESLGRNGKEATISRCTAQAQRQFPQVSRPRQYVNGSYESYHGFRQPSNTRDFLDACRKRIEAWTRSETRVTLVAPPRPVERLLDHLVGGGQQRFRDGQAEGFCGLEVDDELELGVLEDWLDRRRRASIDTNWRWGALAGDRWKGRPNTL
jgi:hypothetical protein